MIRPLLVSLTLLLATFFLSAPPSEADSALLFPYYGYPTNNFTWRATDIVIATEGDVLDGHLQIQEVLKGDSHVGESLDVPELVEFAIHPERDTTTITAEAFAALIGTQRPPAIHLSGAKIWLFLKRDPINHSLSLLSSLAKSQDLSVAWIEQDKIYVQSQYKLDFQSQSFSTPVLKQLGMSETHLRSCIREGIEDQIALSRAVAIANPQQRVEALSALVRELFYSPDDCREKLYLLDVIGKAGGVEVGPELTRLLVKETAFWKQVGPSLQKNWWNDAPMDERKMLQKHHSITIGVLHTLKQIKYEGCRQAVIDVQRFWQSLPQLREIELSITCDSLLQTLDEAKSKE